MSLPFPTTQCWLKNPSLLTPSKQLNLIEILVKDPFPVLCQVCDVRILLAIRSHDNLVIDIGNVTDMENVRVSQVDQYAFEEIVREKGAKITNMGRVVHGGATRVHGNGNRRAIIVVLLLHRTKGFFGSRQGIVENKA